MKTNKAKYICISFMLTVSILFIGNDVLGANILDNVYQDIIPGQDILVFTVNNTDEAIKFKDVKSKFNQIGINVTNAVPDIICTGTRIQTDYNNNKVFTALIYGDVNSDGCVDIFDSQSILLHDVFGADKALTGIDYIAGNVLNEDDVLDIFDSQRILRFYVGLEKDLVLNDKPLNVDTTKPIITLIGEENITIEVGSKYIDKGIVANDNCDGNITSKVVVGGIVNANKLGVYTITYNVTDARGNKATQITRNVTVVDTTAPVITLDNTNIYNMEIFGTKPIFKATVKDNYDSNVSIKITDNIDVNKLSDKYIVTFTATDSNNNTTIKTITFAVRDTTAPVITCVSSNVYEIKLGGTIPEFTATVKDNYDSNLNVTITNNIDVNKVSDKYIVTFTAIDSNGNSSIIDKFFKVIDTTKPTITIDSANVYSMEVNGIIPEFKAVAKDNYGKDVSVVITNNIDVKLLGNNYTVTFTATDVRGNIEVKTITSFKVVDTTKPEIKLNGSNEVTVITGKGYIDAKAILTDNYDNNKEIEGLIYEDGKTLVTKIDTSKVGYYEIKYNDKDLNGNIANEIIRKVYIRNEVKNLIYTDSIVEKQLFTNSKDSILLNKIKINKDEVLYNVTDLKVQILKDGITVLSSKDLDIQFVKNGEFFDIMCNTKNEIGSISITPYIGTDFANSTIKGVSIPLRVINDVDKSTLTDDSNNTLRKNIEFMFGLNIVDIMSKEVILNKTDTTNIADGQIIINKEGNFDIKLMTIIDGSNNIIPCTDNSKVKYIDIIPSSDGNEPVGIIKITIKNVTYEFKVEKSILKKINLKHTNITMKLSDPSNYSTDKVKNKEIIRKAEGNLIYTLIPIEFLRNDTQIYDKMTVGNVQVTQGNIFSERVKNTVTFSSNNKALVAQLKLYAIEADNSLVDVTTKTARRFDYIGFYFTEELKNTQITINYSDIIDSSLLGYVESKTITIN
ncbi:MAG: DUF5011 domain-containing protein [Clostridia bacterium]